MVVIEINSKDSIPFPTSSFLRGDTLRDLGECSSLVLVILRDTFGYAMMLLSVNNLLLKFQPCLPPPAMLRKKIEAYVYVCLLEAVTNLGG